MALISDSHGPVDERIAAIAQRCDRIVHAGDLCDPAVAAWIAAHPAGSAVHGNNDLVQRRSTATRTPLTPLPEVVEIGLPGGQLAVIHGHQFPRVATRHSRLRQRFPAARAIVYGHSHRLCCDTESDPWVINPGACGYRRTYGGPSCVILHATPRHWRLETVRFGQDRA